MHVNSLVYIKKTLPTLAFQIAIDKEPHILRNSKSQDSKSMSKNTSSHKKLLTNMGEALVKM